LRQYSPSPPPEPGAESSAMADGIEPSNPMPSQATETESEPNPYFVQLDLARQSVRDARAQGPRQEPAHEPSEHERQAVAMAVSLWQAYRQFPDGSRSPFQGDSVTVSVNVPELIDRVRGDHPITTSSRTIDGQGNTEPPPSSPLVDGTDSPVDSPPDSEPEDRGESPGRP